MILCAVIIPGGINVSQRLVSLVSGSCIGWAPEETQPVPGKLRFLLPVVIEFDSAGAGEESQNSVEDIENLQWRAMATSGVQSLDTKINHH